MKYFFGPERSRASGRHIPFAFFLLVGLILLLTWPTEVHARQNGKEVEYQNFDPNGRLATLEQEAVEASSQIVVKQQRMDREMVIQTVLQAAVQEGQDPALVLAVAIAESRLDPYSISPRGAAGVMQLMPPTARRFGCRNIYDVYQNAACGARYLGFLLNRYNGNVQLALAAYNAGPAPVDRTFEIPRIGETQAFVQKVLQLMDEVRLELP